MTNHDGNMIFIIVGGFLISWLALVSSGVQHGDRDQVTQVAGKEKQNSMETVYSIIWLVVWIMNYIFLGGNVIIPTDFLIFFRGVGQPPTREIHRLGPQDPPMN
jgi:hypothetical protein